MLKPWSFALARLALVWGLAALAGWIFGQLVLWLLFSTGGYLAWHMVNLYRLDHWLRSGKIRETPDAPGLWGEVFAQAAWLRRRSRERKRRLRRLLKEFRKSTGALPDGGVVLNAASEIVWFNAAAARLLGLRRKVDYGQRIDNLVRNPAFVDYLKSAEFSAPIQLPSPVSSAASLSFQVIPYGDDQHLLLVKDITHEVELERVRRDFVANASHELRSPLTVISGYVDTMADEVEHEGWREPLREMRRQAARMNTIVQNLLELSRLESTGEEAEWNEVDVPGIAALIRKEALAVDPRPQEVELVVESDTNLLGVEGEIHSAFSNLVANALKFTPTTGRVELRWWTDDGGGHFAVTDTGIGISREHLPRLTERFYRVDAGRSRAEGGTGLGLAIVKHVLQRHAARLEITSEPDAGSTFTCHFPPERLAAKRQSRAS